MTDAVRWTVTPDGMVSMQTLTPVEIDALFNAVAGLRLMIKEKKPWYIPDSAGAEHKPPEPKEMTICPMPDPASAECSS